METTSATPTRQRKPRAKAPRHIGVAVRPSDVNPFLVLKQANDTRPRVTSTRVS
jgi:hypothetical protein